MFTEKSKKADGSLPENIFGNILKIKNIFQHLLYKKAFSTSYVEWKAEKLTCGEKNHGG